MRRALGRGIGNLFPGDSSAAAPATGAAVRALPTADERNGGYQNTVPIDQINPNPAQPRKTIADDALGELAESIRLHGLLLPLLVRSMGRGYELVAGERRWRAAKVAGLTEVPVIIRESTDAESFELALIENVQRQDLTPLEEAHAYSRLMEEFGLTQEEVANRVGKKRATVANIVRLLALPDEVQAHIACGALSMGHARALLAARSAARQIALALEVVKRGISVREVERLAAAQGTARPGRKAAKPDVHVKALEDELCQILGTRVRLNHRSRGGSIEIVYHSAEELDRLVDLLRGRDERASNAL
jgi:ParB family chromosome partitioning protein